jgi:hypothetical protein
MKFELSPFNNELYLSIPHVEKSKVIEISEYQGNITNKTVEISKSISHENFVSISQDINTSQIASLFNIQTPKALAFINSRLELAKLLIEANEQIRKRFPSESLSIDFADGTLTSLWVKIELSIITSLDVDTAFSRFDEFNENWWFSYLNESTKDLFIVLKFQD